MVLQRVWEFLLWVPICSNLVFNISALCSDISFVILSFSVLIFGSEGLEFLSIVRYLIISMMG